MGADEGREGRKQEEEGGVALFSALQLLFSWIITLQPPPPDSKNQGNPSSLETGVTSKLTLWL